ncbi:hypothetical protein H0H92_015904 [Tricholoma furcatifolium]|nr:hypothetical protein H0H92_015904 [Tricholoma furcatifolium]
MDKSNLLNQFPPDHLDDDNALVKDASRLGNSSLLTTENDPAPVITQVRALSKALLKIFSDPKRYETFLKYEGEAAQDVLDFLQKYLDFGYASPKFRQIVYVALVRLCRKSHVAPRCFYFSAVDYQAPNPWLKGRRGDLYKGSLKNVDVCLKRLELGDESPTNRETRKTIEKAFTREAVTWGQLKHPNILPFLGIYKPSKALSPGFYLVSPWVAQDILKFLLEKSTEPGWQFDRRRLVLGIAAGLKHLHENGVVHGNFKCSDVLVDAMNQALITDFGLAYVSDVTGINEGNHSSTRQTADPDRISFVAPEHFGNKERRTCASDVFNFGLVCYQIFTTPSIRGVCHVHDLQKQILNKEVIQLPQEPEVEQRGLTLELRTLLLKCLSVNPGDRPTMIDIVQRLELATHVQTFEQLWLSNKRESFTTSSGNDDTVVKICRRLAERFPDLELPPVPKEESTQKPGPKSLLKSMFKLKK